MAGTAGLGSTRGLGRTGGLGRALPAESKGGGWGQRSGAAPHNWEQPSGGCPSNLPALNTPQLGVLTFVGAACQPGPPSAGRGGAGHGGVQGLRLGGHGDAGMWGARRWVSPWGERENSFGERPEPGGAQPPCGALCQTLSGCAKRRSHRGATFRTSAPAHLVPAADPETAPTRPVTTRSPHYSPYRRGARPLPV